MISFSVYTLWLNSLGLKFLWNNWSSGGISFRIPWVFPLFYLSPFPSFLNYLTYSSPKSSFKLRPFYISSYFFWYSVLSLSGLNGLLHFCTARGLWSLCGTPQTVSLLQWSYHLGHPACLPSSSSSYQLSPTSSSYSRLLFASCLFFQRRYSKVAIILGRAPLP